MVSIKPFSVTKGTALNGGGYLYSVLLTAPGPRHQSASPQLMVGVIEQLVWEPEANNRSSKARSVHHAEHRVTLHNPGDLPSDSRYESAPGRAPTQAGSV